MSTRTLVQIQCDACGATATWAPDRLPSAAWVTRTYARASGWAVKVRKFGDVADGSKGPDYCPKCTPEPTA